MLPLPPPTSFGLTAGPISPQYIDPNAKETIQEEVNFTIPQGNIQTPGVPLYKPGEDPPLLEFAFGVRREFTQPSRPPLLPLFRTRFVDGQESVFQPVNDYEELRRSLSSNLRQNLEDDEQLDFRERDPNILAMDYGLRFEAIRRGFVNYLRSGESVERISKQNIEMPLTSRESLGQLGNHIANELEKYLEKMGPNDPSYELFTKTLGQIREGMGLI